MAGSAHRSGTESSLDSPLEETVRSELVSLSEFPVSRELTGNLRRFGAPHGAWKSPQKEQDQSFTSQFLTPRNRELFWPNRELDRSIRELFGVIRGIRSLSTYRLFPPQQPCDVLAATCRYGRHVRPRRVNLAETAFWRGIAMIDPVDASGLVASAIDHKACLVMGLSYVRLRRSPAFH